MKPNIPALFKTCLAILAFVPFLAHGQTPDLTLARDKNWLVIQGAHLPKGEIRINYLEAYCRTNSTDADWHDTTIGHTTELISVSDDRKTMKLRCSTVPTAADRWWACSCIRSCSSA